ncbi:MAG: hydrogenase maturation nickel metallochaperone HypA [Angelakisella sp.]
MPLKIETLPAVTHCEGCGENYPTVRHGRTCPYCGSEKTWLLRGNEISIEEIEAI